MKKNNWHAHSASQRNLDAFQLLFSTTGQVTSTNRKQTKKQKSSEFFSEVTILCLKYYIFCPSVFALVNPFSVQTSAYFSIFIIPNSVVVHTHIVLQLGKISWFQIWAAVPMLSSSLHRSSSCFFLFWASFNSTDSKVEKTSVVDVWQDRRDTTT